MNSNVKSTTKRRMNEEETDDEEEVEGNLTCEVQCHETYLSHGVTMKLPFFINCNFPIK